MNQGKTGNTIPHKIRTIRHTIRTIPHTIRTIPHTIRTIRSGRDGVVRP